jgi:hypothetical protein
MFYTLASVHHQIVTREGFLPPNRFWYVLPGLPYGVQNTTVFQLELDHLMS